MTDAPIYTVELGRLYEEQGFYGKAREHFGAALVKDPDSTLLKEAVERVSCRTQRADDMPGLTGLVDRWVTLLFLKRRVALLRCGQRSDV